jgi:hypothetical protein
MNKYEMIYRLRKGEGALELSIQKWEDIVNGKGENEGLSNCALCKLYYGSVWGFHCHNCPIMKRAGLPFCRGTPYKRFPTLDEAKKELNFLKSFKER